MSTHYEVDDFSSFRIEKAVRKRYFEYSLPWGEVVSEPSDLEGDVREVVVAFNRLPFAYTMFSHSATPNDHLLMSEINLEQHLEWYTRNKHEMPLSGNVSFRLNGKARRSSQLVADLQRLPFVEIEQGRDENFLPWGNRLWHLLNTRNDFRLYVHPDPSLITLPVKKGSADRLQIDLERKWSEVLRVIQNYLPKRYLPRAA